MQDLEWCIRGRVVTISDLKEVLKAKTEEKDRQKGGEERSYHGDSYYSWERSVKQQSVVITNKKASKKLCLRLNFFSIFDLGAFLEKSFFRLLKERDCDVVVTFRSHNSRKNGKKMHNPTVLAN